MDIQEDKDFAALPEVAKLYQACKERDLTIAEREYLKGARDAWQAAKAQAVPDGFVLVPMVPSERMIKAVRQCYEGEAYLPYSLYSEFVNQAIIERMEAQEPAND